MLRTKKKPTSWSKKLTIDSPRSKENQISAKLITINWRKISSKRKLRSNTKKIEEPKSKWTTKNLSKDSDKKESVRSTGSWKRLKNVTPQRRINTATSFTTTCFFCTLKTSRRKHWRMILRQDKSRSTITSLINLKHFLDQLRWKIRLFLPKNSRTSSQNHAQDQKMSSCSVGSTHSTKSGSRKLSSMIRMRKIMGQIFFKIKRKSLYLKQVPRLALQLQNNLIYNLRFKLKKKKWLPKLRLILQLATKMQLMNSQQEANKKMSEATSHVPKMALIFLNLRQDLIIIDNSKSYFYLPYLNSCVHFLPQWWGFGVLGFWGFGV